MKVRCKPKGEGEVKDEGPAIGPSLSTFAVLPPPTPGAGSGNGSPRGSRPPELPAGKRGGWHHDSVYPSFRLTSFAPRAVNFEPECTSGHEVVVFCATKLLARCHASTAPW